ncbi:unnamed protein product [Urochloa humidicola]
MEMGESKKKAQVESPINEVKEEVLDRDEASGQGALVNMERATAAVEFTFRMDVAKLHCPICKLPLKPPIFQCAVGRLACGFCHDHLPDKDQCFVCGLIDAYVRSTVLEDMVESIRIHCPYDVYGFPAYVTYHAVSDHQQNCPWAPCACTEPGCGFVGSLPMLRDHLRDVHAWPVDKLRYGKPCHLRLPASQSRRLLDAVDDDGRVFLVSVGTRGGGERRGVVVACLRTAAAAGPQYFCKMWVSGNPGPATGRLELASAEANVPSISAVPGNANAAADVAPLSVPRTMLHGESMEMDLNVKIEKPKE